jgi:hypothetical protein
MSRTVGQLDVSVAVLEIPPASQLSEARDTGMLESGGEQGDARMLELDSIELVAQDSKSSVVTFAA